MLIPRRVKHRKQHHPDRHGASKGGNAVSFGQWGLQAMEPAYVTNRQIESARIAMTRHIRRGGKVKPGRVMFEIAFPNEKVAHEALTRAMHKLPMKCRIVAREEI
jgi:large subunit ribosomal protein L16